MVLQKVFGIFSAIAIHKNTKSPVKIIILAGLFGVWIPCLELKKINLFYYHNDEGVNGIFTSFPLGLFLDL